MVAVSTNHALWASNVGHGSFAGGAPQEERTMAVFPHTLLLLMITSDLV